MPFSKDDPNINRNGAPTKAERMGLERNLNEAFKRMSKVKGMDNMTAPEEAILHLMWDKAQKGEMKAIEWIAHRYYGKEPEALIVSEGDAPGLDRGSIKDIFAQSFEEDGEE